MGFMSKDVICSNLIKFIPSATLYHFGILESNVHMAWMRAVCGRLKSDYRYSKDVVYNNFPWPTPTAEQKAKIEQSAQAILDARALYPDLARRPLRPDAHAEGTPSGSSPERPSRNGSLRLPDEDDGERMRGRTVQEV